MVKNINSLKATLRELNVITEKNQINKQANRMLQTRFVQTYNEVLSATKFLQYDAPLRDRIYCVLHDVIEQPTCLVCGQVMKFNHQKNRFNQYCQNRQNHSCGMNSSDVVARIKQTSITRYGVSNAATTEAVANKRKTTMVERHGVPYMMQHPDFRQLLKEKVSVDRAAIEQRRKDTMNEKYGRDYFSQTSIDDSAYKVLSNPEKIADLLKDFSKTELALFLGVNVNVVHVACKRFGIEYKPIKKPGSVQQQTITKFVVENYDGEIILDAKYVIPKYDLDIYLPDLKLAIEYNGIFFHGEQKNRGKQYHVNKLLLCEQHGIRLIQVWSSEWLYKKPIVKSRILSALNKSSKIYARACEVIQIPAELERDFFTANHTQGYSSSSVNYALTFNSTIVAVMSFGHSKRDKTYQWELVRFSTITGVTVVGGASRLLTAFKRAYHPSSIISYCDLRWGTRKLYDVLGFQPIFRSKPNYFYFQLNGDTNKLHSRVKFQKHKLTDLLPVFDSNKTEWENMIANGYDRIWDCGNDVFGWNASNDTHSTQCFR